jgi:hypothetical protein
MSRDINFPACPNCGRRPFFGCRIYRCPACMQLVCDGCMQKSWFHEYCPRCRARLDLNEDIIGYV